MLVFGGVYIYSADFQKEKNNSTLAINGGKPFGACCFFFRANNSPQG